MSPPVPGGTPAAAAVGGRPCPWVDGASAPPSPSSKLKDIRRFRFAERGVGAAAGAMWGGGFMDRGRPLATEEWGIGVGGGGTRRHTRRPSHAQPTVAYAGCYSQWVALTDFRAAAALGRHRACQGVLVEAVLVQPQGALGGTKKSQRYRRRRPPGHHVYHYTHPQVVA